MILNWTKFKWKLQKNESLFLLENLKESFTSQQDLNNFHLNVKIQILFSLGKLKTQLTQELKVKDANIEKSINEFMKEVALSVKNKIINKNNI